MTSPANPLLDPPLITPDRLERLEGAIASLFETRLDVVLPQAEAVLPLEAAARSLGRSDLTVLNLDTSPYGTTMGRWLQETGASVIGIAPEPHEAVRPEAVKRTLSEHPDISVVSFVHVEAASGVRNDAAAISGLAHEHGALIVIDLVASIGAHEVRLDEWGADIAVIGPQKALAGPAGISIAAVSGRAWQAMADNPGAPRSSLLSLLDWKERWLDSDKSAIPGTPAPLEIIALEAAIERVLTEGLQHVQLRHRASAAASRSGARALGLTPFANDSDAAAVATTLRAGRPRCPRLGRTGARRKPCGDLARLRQAGRDRPADRPHRPARPPRRRARSPRSTWQRPRRLLPTARLDPRRPRSGRTSLDRRGGRRFALGTPLPGSRRFEPGCAGSSMRARRRRAGHRSRDG